MKKIALAMLVLITVGVAYPKTDCTGLNQADCKYLTQVNAGMID